MCNNKIFNKLFFFSFVFLFLSVMTHLVSSAQPLPREEKKQSTTTIQIQQKQIMSRLKDVENKITFSSRRGINGKTPKKKRL